jgi:hypothetical protein
MKRAQLNALAQEILSTETARLRQLPYAKIEQWPDFPNTPNMLLEIPTELSEYKYSLMKDTLPDRSIRVAIQLYRHRFLGIGWMTADGFVISPNGNLRNFTQEDIWEVT